MNFDEKRRNLLKLLCGTMMTLAATATASRTSAAATQKPRPINVALLSLRTATRIEKFKASIEREFRRVAPQHITLKLVSIPSSVQGDRLKLQDALSQMPFFACISENVAATLLAADLPEAGPVIFTIAGDPALSGLMPVAPQKRRNFTGFTSYAPTDIKRWEILSEAFPDIERIVVLASAGGPAKRLLASAGSVSDFIGRIEVAEIDVRKNPVQQVRAALSRRRIGVDVPHTALTSASPYSIIDCINETRHPCIYDGTHYVRWGGLLSYEADPLPEAQTISEYLLLLLQGVPPDKIPIRYPSSFTLAVNLQTGKASGIELRKSLLLRTNTFIKNTDRPAGLT
jgi:ABC-type uncharacterized transport system substrate-binding protein